MSVLRIVHQTTWRHSAPAAVAWQTLHLHPRREAGQECLSFDLEILPRPADVAPRTDFFGNILHVFSVSEPHGELAVNVQSVVRRAAPAAPMAGLTPSLAAAAGQVDVAVRDEDFALEQYRHASPLVPLLTEARAIADGLEKGNPPVLAWIEALGTRFGERFAFDARATAVSTPLAEALGARRGVCQDFAHAWISCVRQWGLPAAYVSGYLLTQPPPGQPRLLGADAMHAWASVFVPGFGWVDYDPTNRVFAGAGHIVVARGRDYADVSPVRGVFSGGGAQTLYLGVTVEPGDEPVST